jgi:hypothetical protein
MKPSKKLVFFNNICSWPHSEYICRLLFAPGKPQTLSGQYNFLLKLEPNNFVMDVVHRLVGPRIREGQR